MTNKIQSVSWLLLFTVLFSQDTFDAVTGLFTVDTALPQVMVLMPNGGEEINFDQQIPVIWSAADDSFGAAPISVGVSIIAGGDYEIIAENLTNSGATTILPPQTATDEARVQVSAVDAFGNTGVDASDEFFSIGLLYPDILTPDGGEIIAGAAGQNHQYEITWSTANQPAGTDNLALYYSTDSGNTFPYLIAENEPDDGNYLWLVPNLNSSNVRIKIMVYGSTSNLIASGMSENDFTIDGTPPSGTLTLSAPANGTWTDGLPYFDWNQSGLTDVINLAIVVDNVYLTTTIPTNHSYYQTPSEFPFTGGWHIWTVRGLDIAGNYVQAAQYWSFQVDAAPPSLFYLLQPEDDIWLGDPVPTFMWTPSMDNGSGLVEYEMYLNDGLAMGNLNPLLTQWSPVTDSRVDDFEAGLSNWNTQGSWGLTTTSHHAGEYSVADSPGGNYGNNQNVTLTLADPVDLTGATSLNLTYWYHCDFYYTYTLYDHVYVEISSNGSSWTQIADYDTDQWSWSHANHNLNGYLNWSQIYVRFRLVTNSYGTADGFYLDDLALVGSGLEISDGDFEWYVKALDAVGNVQQSADTFGVHIDTTPPHGDGGIFVNLDPPNNFWTADSLLSFSWQPCSDDGIGFEYYSLWVDAVNISGELPDPNYSLGIEQVLESGTHSWSVTAGDSLGNTLSTSQFILNIDRIPPAEFSLLALADSALYNMPTPEFSWTPTTDSGSGLSHYELWIDGTLSVDNLTDTQSTPGFPLFEGYHTWYVIAEDEVGNRLQSNEVWTAIGDWSPPTQPGIIYPTNNETVSLSQPDLIWLKSTDAGSGLSYYDLYIDNNLVYDHFIPQDIEADTVLTECPVALENGSHTWYVRAFDHAGSENSSVYGFFVVDVDITAPTSELTDPVFDQYIGGENYLIMGTAEDNAGGSGVALVEISFDSGNTWFETTEAGRSLSPTLSAEQTEDHDFPAPDSRTIYYWEFLWTGYETGSFNIMTRAIDHNGNIESPPNALQINVEIVLPEISSMSISPDPAPDGLVQFVINFLTGEHCGGMNIAATPVVTCTPYGGVEIPVTQTNYVGNTWYGQITIAGFEANGTAVITVSGGTDNINNVMEPDSSYSFVIDTEPPYPFDLITPVDDTWTNDAQPLLTWGAAADLTTGISYYSLEIDGSTSPPGIGYISSGQTSAEPAAPLTLGEHTWRIRATDHAGNFIWSTSTFTIGFDLTDPVSQITSPIDDSSIGGLTYTITGTATDGGGVGISGIDFVEIRMLHNGIWTDWLPVINTGSEFDTWSYEWEGYEAGYYTLESRAADRAGNLEIPQLQVTVFIDLYPPEIENVEFDPDPVGVGGIVCTIYFHVNVSGLDYSIHPTVIFITPDGFPYLIYETSFADDIWTGAGVIDANMQNGLATLQVVGVTDNLGNTMEPNYNAGYFLIDTQAPTVLSTSVTPNITNIRTDLIVEVLFNETGSGLNTDVFPEVQIIPSGMNLSDSISVTQTGYDDQANIWSGVAEITELANEGYARIRILSAADLVGNVMATVMLDEQFVIDYSPPQEFDVLFPTDSLWIADRQPEITWLPTVDLISGLSEYQFYLNEEQVGAGIAPDITSAPIETPLPDGGYRVQIAALDNSDEPNIQWSGESSVYFNIDGSSPNSEITFPTPEYIMESCSLRVEGTADDGTGVYAGIGVQSVFLSPDGGENWDTVYVAPDQFINEITWEHDYCLDAGSHTLVCRSVDWLGNAELDGSSVSITAPQPGDLNSDGLINIFDIVITVNIIMGEIDPTAHELWAADVNTDGEINVLDVVGLVQIIMQGGLSKGQPVTSASITINKDMMQIETEGDFAGIQLWVTGDFEIEDNTLPVGWEIFSNNEIILVYNMDGTSLLNNFKIEYEGELSINASIIADWHGNNLKAQLISSPTSFALKPAYPNPFNPVTKISYALAEKGDVEIKVLDLNGREVTKLVHSIQTSGYYTVIWDASEQSSGIYFVVMNAEDFIKVQKVLLLK